MRHENKKLPIRSPEFLCHDINNLMCLGTTIALESFRHEFSDSKEDVINSVVVVTPIGSRKGGEGRSKPRHLTPTRVVAQDVFDFTMLYQSLQSI